MEKPKSVLVIYRLKFRSKAGFESAIQTFQFGEKFGLYLQSLQRSFSLSSTELNYPRTTLPEINFCKDDFVIYVCSYENAQYLKGPAAIDIMSKSTSESMPRLPYYYELFLKSTFGSIADLSIAAGDCM
jgi:hypothetical protein